MFSNDSNLSCKHPTVRLELESNGFLSSRCFLLTLENLENHSMDDMMYGKPKVIIFDHLDYTLSWVDELLVYSKMYYTWSQRYLWWIFINDLKANRYCKLKIHFSSWKYVTCRIHGKNGAVHVIEFRNGVEKWDYATTRSPDNVKKWS